MLGLTEAMQMAERWKIHYQLMPDQLKEWLHEFLDKLERNTTPTSTSIGEVKSALNWDQGIYVPKTVLYAAMQDRHFLLSVPSNEYAYCFTNVSKRSIKQIRGQSAILDRYVPDLYKQWDEACREATDRGYCDNQ